MNPMDLLTGWVDKSKYEGLISPAYYTLKNKNKNCDNSFITYLLQTFYKTKYFFKFGQGVASHSNDGRWVITPYEFNNFVIKVPSLAKQIKASLILEEKIALLDELILKSELKIELLNEQLISTIYNFVTKGVEQKSLIESGIPWIGKIPSHWKISKIGRHFTLERGRVISHEEINEHPGTYPVYSSQTKNNGEMGHIDTYDFEGEYVSWTTDGAYAGTCFYRNGKFNVTNVCGLLSPKLETDSFDLKFIKYFLNVGTKYYVRQDINPKLMNDMMSEIPLLIIPIKEQIEIKSIIEEKYDVIQEILNSEKRKIDLLNEYKDALIFNMVTGRIDSF
jgi:restriction endonuclease S subunit